MARAATWLYGAGGTLTLMSLAVPGLPARPGALFGLVIASYAAALFFWVGGDRLPHWMFQLMTAFATLLVTAAVGSGGGLGVSYSLFYLWITVFVFYFFSQPEALLHLVLIFAGSALALSWPLGAEGAREAQVPMEWIVLVGSCLVTGLLVDRLVEGLRQHARTDFLTGAVNRRAWDEEVEWALARARRDGFPVGLILVDLDNFKAFNDEHGHRHGDRFLQEAVAGWREVLRTGDVLARYGGEEFGVLLPGCTLESALTIAERVRRALRRGQTCSAGVALWDGRESAEALVSRADAALYEAKRQGRNRTVNAADPGSLANSEAIFETARWADPILEVLAGRGLEAVYQPVVGMRKRSLEGYEALARPHGSAADASVEGLFAAAQRMGVIRDLDWACRKVGVAGAAGLSPEVPLFLNVSLAALLDPLHGVDKMLVLLAAAGRSPSSIVLEIGTGDVVTDPARLRVVAASYREQGFRLCLDDVGQGSSGLEAMAALVPEYIKVSQRFTLRVQDPGTRSAIGAVLAFAASTGARVIAEGVETEELARRLLQMGVELGQGYWLGPPVSLRPEEGARTAKRVRGEQAPSARSREAGGQPAWPPK